MKRLAPLLLALLAFAGGWLLARHQGAAQLAGLRVALAARDSALLVRTGETAALADRVAGQAAVVRQQADSVAQLVARVRALRARPLPEAQVAAGPVGGPAGPVTDTDGPRPAGAESPARLVDEALVACHQLAQDCAALADSVEVLGDTVQELGLTVRRYATTLDSILADAGAPPPALEIRTGGFTTGLAIGATGTASLLLVLVLVFAH